MSKTSNESGIPKSIRHKQILDTAADRPNASIEEIASEVSSATTDLVDQVLEEYGDPANSNSGTSDSSNSQTADSSNSQTADSSRTEGVDSPRESSDSSSTDEADSSRTERADASAGSTTTSSTESSVSSNAGTIEYPDPEDLPAKQRKTLRAIADHPEATQRELAELLDVSAPTVGNRANAIEGFDWDDRKAFAEAVYDADSTPNEESLESTSESDDYEPNSGGNDPESGSREEDAESAAGGEDPDSSSQAEDIDQMPTDQTDVSTAIDQLANRVTNIERRLEEMNDAGESSSAFSDPDLVHKVVHGCLKYDAITEEEELRILSELLGE